MFDTVPGELTQALRGLPDGLKTPDMRHLAAGGLVTAHYLRSQDPLRGCGLPDADIAREEAARLVQIGDLLFTLRLEPGFEALCRRLQDAGLRTALFELTAAVMFKRHGFEIHPRPAGGLPRYTLSFQAVKDAAAVNVAVLSFEDRQFEREAVLEALWRMRRRLPDDAPAALFCLHPAYWRHDAWDLDFTLGGIARRVLREARRINYLLFAQEHFSSVEGAGVISISGFAARNMGARLPCPPLDSALMDSAFHNRAIEPVVTLPRRLDEGAFGYGDFDQWVNWAADG
ncbi:MAG TPA: hypothetical protein VGD19_13185 [Allosphingosinicella sp.]|jgi:hypothetical protein